MEKKDHTPLALFFIAILVLLFLTLGLFLDHNRKMKQIELVERGIIKDYTWPFNKN